MTYVYMLDISLQPFISTCVALLMVR